MSTGRWRPGPVARALLAAIALLLGGCAVLTRPGDAGPALAAFVPFDTDPRVRIEAGAEAGGAGALVAALLPGAIAQVERVHGRRFARPVRVHVCASSGCFERLLPRPPGMTAAVAFDNRLILAARLFDREPHRLRPILVHELSHLHLGQRLGHYTLAIPVWFHEGFASWVAEGGGADLASDAQARAAFSRGQSPIAAASGPDAPIQSAAQAARPVDRPGQATDRAPSSIAYRQSLWFVDWLVRSRPLNFAWFIDALQEGWPFDSAFAHGFGEPVAAAHAAFVRSLGLPDGE